MLLDFRKRIASLVFFCIGYCRFANLCAPLFDHLVHHGWKYLIVEALHSLPTDFQIKV